MNLVQVERDIALIKLDSIEAKYNDLKSIEHSCMWRESYGWNLILCSK
jgi:hypothetical protein